MLATRTTHSRGIQTFALCAFACVAGFLLVAGAKSNTLASNGIATARAGMGASVFNPSSMTASVRASSRNMMQTQPRFRPGVSVHAAVKGEKTFSVDKPLGLKLGQGANGLTVKGVSGNAAKAGIKSGDTVIYTSSFFGDELWPSDKLSFTQSALKAAPSPVTIITTSDAGAYDIKRLTARPAPKRFGKKLSAKQKELATHLCLDCGYIYCDETPFKDLPADYVCPQCNAGTKRFGTFDVTTGKITEPISVFQIVNILIVILGLGVVGFLGYFGLKLS
mmetsp:Transcript_24528/g.47889  ORF Transcript_24528/g.47889 Transcript_24528/m.47889 type:complete len:278 (+) Transcript_24528:28-861(+)|eukprot:CAMPEP_0167788576 /NCGR_PEP_ID=MMETSP0111_2-20121227/10125_1 /TAXON_ID=91324 /ORGANISM="Lotharella globosa, Strain CCCM811" /LENGTH=277 /DNA_ID=CAMNT_0007680485 /DNA_START=26 /DNA_END=859 /DNA_ORIENTATION=+